MNAIATDATLNISVREVSGDSLELVIVGDIHRKRLRGSLNR